MTDADTHMPDLGSFFEDTADSDDKVDGLEDDHDDDDDDVDEHDKQDENDNPMVDGFQLEEIL